MATSDPAYDADVANAKALLDQFGDWINTYRGGMPGGWMAAIMAHESDGNFAAPGDPTLGEVGYYQIAAYVPPLFGLDADARNDPESNVAIASLEYALEVAYWKAAFPDAVQLGTGDSWRLARLAFAVGRAGSHQLAQLALQATGQLTPGDVYGDIVRLVSSSGAPALGSQSASKVTARVIDIGRQWNIGQDAGGGAIGPPTYIPSPPAGDYTIPADAVDYFVQPLPAFAFVLLGGLAVLYYLWSR